MAKKSLTVEEVKKRKIQLEKDIMDLLQDFEKETGTRLGYVDVQRKSDDEGSEISPVEMDFVKKDINNVDINMDIE